MKKVILLFTLILSAAEGQYTLSQWTQLPNLPVTGTVWDMYFINQTTGWMTLQSPTSIMKTTDGGLSWIVQSYSSIRELQFIDSTLGYATGFVGTNGVLWKTTDGGANWNSTYTINIFTDLFFANKDTGWFSGGDGFLGGVWQTTDGGASFQRKFTSATGTLDRIFFLKEKVNGQYIGWTLAVPVLYKTINSGQNWVQIYNGFSSQCGGGYSIFFIDSSKGIITRGNGCINNTTDGGYNWLTINEFNVSAGGRITMANNQVGWISLATDSVIKTTNFFQTYGKQPIPIVASRSIFALDTSVVYAALNQNAFIKTTNGGGPISGLTLVSQEVLNEFILYQNYPNPFNPVTNIKYQIPARSTGGVKSSKVKLTVYDILGREIAILVNQNQRPGIYQVEWKPDNLSGGIYLYTLQTEDFRDTKKLVYIK